MKGEVIQMKGVRPGTADSQVFDVYLRKNYYKTGSLMANSCKAACLLNGTGDFFFIFFKFSLNFSII